MTLHPYTAEETLRVVTNQALAAEGAHRYSTRDKRTVRRVINPTPANVYPRLVLDVTAAYAPFIERMCFYGNGTAAASAGDKYGAKVHFEYVAWCEGERYPLTEAQAVALLETSELPVPRHRHYNDGSDPFKGLGGFDGLPSHGRGPKAVQP